MENNKMRFKMYKSGKNWMVAGLMTTAVLAGLTLSNVNNNDVVAHADTVATTATTNNTCDKAAHDAASQAVTSAQNNVNIAQSNADSTNAALNSAESLNEGVNALNKAQSNASSAFDQYQQAQSAESKATKASQDAKKAYDEANTHSDWWNQFGEKAYNDITSKINSQSADLSSAQAMKPDADASFHQAEADLSVADNAGMDKNSTKYQWLVHDKKSKYNKMNDINKAIQNAKSALADLNDKLNGKKPINSLTNQKKDLASYKALMDKLPDLKKNADEAHDAFMNARKATEDAKNVWLLAEDNVDAIRDQYNLPDSAGLETMHRNAIGAKKKIQEDKTTQSDLKTVAGNKLSDATTLVSLRNATLDDAKSNASSAQSEYDVATSHLTDAQQAVTDAQAAFDKDNSKLNTQLLKEAKGALSKWQGTVAAKKDALDRANKALKDAQHDADFWNKQVNDAKASDAYRKLENDIKKGEGIINKYNEANENVKNAQDVENQIASLQAAADKANKELTSAKNVLAAAQAKLAAIEAECNGDNNKPGDNTNPSKPGDNTNPSKPGDNTNPSKPGDNTNPGDAVKPGNGSTANNGNGSVNGSVNGSTTEVAHASVISGSKTSVDSSKSANKVNPQTGNSDSAAVVALGALSTMLGLGMVAKKREF